MNKYELKFWYTIYVGGRLPCRKLFTTQYIMADNIESARIEANTIMDILKIEMPRINEITVKRASILKSILN